MRLIAIPGAKLQEDGVADLSEAKLEDLGLDLLLEAVRVNIDLAEI
jgi:hypothetical protein